MGDPLRSLCSKLSSTVCVALSVVAKRCKIGLWCANSNVEVWWDWREKADDFACWWNESMLIQFINRKRWFGWDKPSLRKTESKCKSIDILILSPPPPPPPSSSFFFFFLFTARFPLFSSLPYHRWHIIVAVSAGYIIRCSVISVEILIK